MEKNSYSERDEYHRLRNGGLQSIMSGEFGHLKGTLDMNGYMRHEISILFCDAVGVGNFELVKYYYEYGGVDIDFGGGRPIREACFRGDAAIFFYLVDKGCEIGNIYNECYRFALRGKNCEILRYLSRYNVIRGIDMDGLCESECE